MKYTLICLTILCYSCTCNISMAHTSGKSVNKTDDETTDTPTLSPNIKIPLTPV